MECVGKIRGRHPFQLDAYVVLPDHLHALWTLPDGDTSFSTRWRLIKEAFTRAYIKGLWRSLSKREPSSKRRAGRLAKAILGARDPRRARFRKTSRLHSHQSRSSWAVHDRSGLAAFEFLAVCRTRRVRSPVGLGCSAGTSGMGETARIVRACKCWVSQELDPTYDLAPTKGPVVQCLLLAHRVSC